MRICKTFSCWDDVIFVLSVYIVCWVNSIPRWWKLSANLAWRSFTWLYRIRTCLMQADRMFRSRWYMRQSETEDWKVRNKSEQDGLIASYNDKTLIMQLINDRHRHNPPAMTFNRLSSLFQGPSSAPPDRACYSEGGGRAFDSSSKARFGLNSLEA